jgi:pleckstrin homology domain containing family A member 8
LRQKYSIDNEKYRTLQNIVQQEVDDKVTTVKNSATDALLWLKRAIWFFKEIFNEILNQDPDDIEHNLKDLIHSSYSKTLQKYHNWVVRSIFTLAMRTLPTREQFMTNLAINKQEYLDNKIQFEKQILQDIKLTVQSVSIPLDYIDQFYLDKKLDK